MNQIAFFVLLLVVIWVGLIVPVACSLLLFKDINYNTNLPNTFKSGADAIVTFIKSIFWPYFAIRKYRQYGNTGRCRCLLGLVAVCLIFGGIMIYGGFKGDDSAWVSAAIFFLGAVIASGFILKLLGAKNGRVHERSQLRGETKDSQ